MFYGQNCSGRLGEKKTVIRVVSSKEDFNFVKLIAELSLKNIKKELNERYFSRALMLAKKYGVKASIVVITTEQFNNWRKILINYPRWFAKLYGIICYNALKPLFNRKIYLQMDREYDKQTLEISAETILKLVSNDIEIYIRKEREYPSSRIIVADLFARGYFKGFDCSSLFVNRKLDLENDIRKIFRSR